MKKNIMINHWVKLLNIKVFRNMIQFIEEDKDENDWLKAYNVELADDGIKVSDFIENKFNYSSEYMRSLEVLPSGIEEKYINPDSVEMCKSDKEISMYIQGTMVEKEREIRKDLRPKTNKWFVDMIYDSFVGAKKKSNKSVLGDEVTFILERENDDFYTLFCPNSRKVIEIPDELNNIFGYPTEDHDLISHKLWYYPAHSIDIDNISSEMRWMFHKLDIVEVRDEYLEFKWSGEDD